MPKDLCLRSAAAAAVALSTCLALVLGVARADSRDRSSPAPAGIANDGLAPAGFTRDDRAPQGADRLKPDSSAPGSGSAAADWDPNDPIYPLQWHHAVIGMPAAWEVTRGEGVTVAVIDSGVNCAHPDLVGQCVAGWDFVDSDAEPQDALGSGTVLAGIVAARADNGQGVAGVAPGARIMPLRMLDADGGGDLDRLAAAITWAATHGAQVAVIGVAGRFDNEALSGAVADAIGRGLVIVASVGAEDTNDRLFPAAYPGVIGVGVTDKADARAPICNYGDTVDVTAPGMDILSTTVDGRYSGSDGTNLAAAVTAGVAALVKAQKPSRQPELVAEILRVSAVDLGAAGWDPYFGAGRIDAARALALDPGGNAPGPPAPTAAQPTLPAPWTPAPAPTDWPHPTDAPPVATAPGGGTAAPNPTDPPAPPAFGTSTPGAPSCSRPWQVVLVGQPDLSGAGGYICPGCDGVMSSGDRFLSTLCPLEPLEIVITDGATGIRKVLWHGFIARPRGSVHEIRASVYLCDPPPYRVTLLTTNPEHYTLCPNSYASQVIAQKDFDRNSNSRPGEGRRGMAAWRFWSCAAKWQP